MLIQLYKVLRRLSKARSNGSGYEPANFCGIISPSVASRTERGAHGCAQCCKESAGRRSRSTGPASAASNGAGWSCSGSPRATPTQDAGWMADKVLNLRGFEDDAGKMNRSVLDIRGGILVVSQFTLLGDCRAGRRPSFTEAAEPVLAERLYLHCASVLARSGLEVATGVFRAMMKVELVNDGPVTLLLDSRSRKDDDDVLNFIGNHRRSDSCSAVIEVTLPWKQPRVDHLCSWAWMSGPRAFGRPWSICTAEPSPLASRRSRPPIPGRRGPSSSRSSGGRRPTRPCGSRWPRGASTPSKYRASASTARPAPSWPATLLANRCALPCSGWISAAFREADVISDTGDPILRYVSGRVSPEWMLPKALWLKRQRARGLRTRRPGRRVHRLDDVSTDRRVDALAQSRRGQMELRAAGRRLAGRAPERGRADRPAREVARADRPAGQGRGALERAGGPRAGTAGREFRSLKEGSTPTWACSAWGRRRTATWL